MNTFTENNLTYIGSLIGDDETEYKDITNELEQGWEVGKDEFIKTYLKVNPDLEYMNGVNSNMITTNNNESVNLTKLSKHELLEKCEELGFAKCKSKNKGELIHLINGNGKKCVIPEIEMNEHQECSNRTYTLVDLFCGTGAFSYAFHKTNKATTIFANDMLDSSEEIFNLNNDIKLTKRNLIEIKDEDVPISDILTAGFPCQPFSIAGMQKGFADERSNVFWKILSIIKKNNPKFVILENVKNLQSHDEGKTFKIIVEHLEKLNYYIKYAILNTCKITGIPQNRERIYIVCFKDKLMYDKFDFDFPEIELKPLTLFLEADIHEKYYYNNSTIIYNKLQTSVINHISTNTIYQYRRYYVRENKNNVCPTLTANMGGGGHNVPIILDDKGIRKLTPKECFNLQGFPIDYKIPSISSNKLYCLAGNAVSIPVVSLIANRLFH
jgi:DNA (cytosine-5)-methyltransferase 1